MKNLEQIRAANALAYAKAGLGTRGQQGGNVLKKLPALVMGNGLLAAGAFAYAQKGDPDQAIANYNEAIRLKWPSKDAVMYQNRGNAYATKGDLDKANADFAKAKKLGYKP